MSMSTPTKKTILDFFKKDKDTNENTKNQQKSNAKKDDHISNTNVNKNIFQNTPISQIDESLNKIVDNLKNKEDVDQNSNTIITPRKKFRSLIESDSEVKEVEREDILSDKTCNSSYNDEMLCNSRKQYDCKVSLNTQNQLKNTKLSSIIADFLNAESFECETQISTEPDIKKSEKMKQENRYEFLVDIRDKNGIRKGEDKYDPTTLFIPKEYYNKFTPFEKQFWDIKSAHYDTIIFFKKGKFFELYEDDAEIASKLFDFKITERVNMKMAGFPESSCDTWAAKFLAHGYKIGKVEQTENAIGKKIREQNTKKDKIIERKLVEIVTQGTIYDNSFISNCYPICLAVIVENKSCHKSESCNLPFHFSALLYDASINKIYSNTFCDDSNMTELKIIFAQNNIKEIICDSTIVIPKNIIYNSPIKTKLVTEKRFDFSCEGEFLCFNYLFNYMKTLCRESSLHNATFSTIKNCINFMNLDFATIQNLDILENNYDKTEEYTLFKAINYCSTPFGARLLRKWVLAPLTNYDNILLRRNIAAIFQSDIEPLRQLLRNLNDVERYHGKLCHSNPTFKDLAQFYKGMERTEKVYKEIISYLNVNKTNTNIIYCNSQIEISEKFLKNISNMLSNFNLTYKITDTEIIPGNSNDELFVLNVKYKEIQNDLKSYLEELKKLTGIKDLCYKSIGKEIYQIEAANEYSLPHKFYVVSATKTAKRYYSQELKELVMKLAEAEEKIFQSNGLILRRAVEFLKSYSFEINYAIDHLATLDCYISFSQFNKTHKATMPIFSEVLAIKNFSNPIYSNYVKNNFSPENKITLITGPNMGGKSTFLRSICLNIIIAQMGMGVPCEYMSLPIFDKIFTRIGASDSLAKGESTFMIEMMETSRILTNSTSHSFVIMDELGRGTSTKDGEAIAKAVLDYLRKISCYTLFSTHYHSLVSDYMGADKAFVKYKFHNNDIVFLYKLEDGICENSHGLDIAKLAGVSEKIVSRAREIRNNFTNK